MAKDKLTLSDLKVQSFVTSLDDEAMTSLKGGHYVKGRQYTYRTRWTAVDTRADALIDLTHNGIKAGG
ncbi:MAG: pinensin family lanthipeptide [Saprospiraceae bacterium]|nr:pinensin family lanthipeptide [Saprospiraceae bacterium]